MNIKKTLGERRADWAAHQAKLLQIALDKRAAELAKFWANTKATPNIRGILEAYVRAGVNREYWSPDLREYGEGMVDLSPVDPAPALSPYFEPNEADAKQIIRLDQMGGGYILNQLTGTGDPRALGVELEMEDRSPSFDRRGDTDRHRYALAFFEDGGLREVTFATSDGSLTYGTETLHAPRTIETWRSQSRTFRKVLGSMQKSGWRSWETGNCGMHVHVDRRCLNSDSIERLDKLVQFVAAPWLQALSGRMLPNENSRRSNNPWSFCAFGDVRRDQKMRALNHRHTQTLEFRFFRGSMDWLRFMANIEVALLLVDFARECRSLQRVIPRSFNTFLETRLRTYPFAFIKYKDVPLLRVESKREKRLIKPLEQPKIKRAKYYV